MKIVVRLLRRAHGSGHRRGRIAFAAALALGLLIAGGCNVGPRYVKPAVETPGAFKEMTPAQMEVTQGWKSAEPADTRLRGKWWEIFTNAELNAIEEQVAVSNQNVASSFATFLSARAVVKEARSAYYPTATTAPALTRQKTVPQNAGISTASSTFSVYPLPFDASWEIDLWGNLRNAVKANTLEAQATFADLENVKLTIEAEVAMD